MNMGLSSLAQTVKSKMLDKTPSWKSLMPQPVLSQLAGNCPRRCLHCGVRSLGLCAVLDSADLHDLERLGKEIRLASKKSLFAEDEKASRVYSLTQGAVRLSKLLPEGRRHIVGFALPGDFLGTSPFDRYGISADAITPIVACQFSRERFARFAEAKPNMLGRMNEFEARELHLARNQMLLLGSRSAEQRVAQFLIGWRERFARFGDVPNILPLPMKRGDIADFLGLTIETVSRTLTRLEREKIIVNVPKGISILSLTRAESLAWH